MNHSKESIEKIATFYRTYSSLFKIEGVRPDKGGVYSMHIGYHSHDTTEQNESSSKLMERKLIRDADIHDGQQILDAGCGTGILGFEIASLYPNTKVYGIDLLYDHLKLASRQRSCFLVESFSQQDYLNLAFRNNSFDRIFFCESLIHAQDKSKLLLEACRVLKPGGKIIIADIFMLVDHLSNTDQLGLSQLSEETGIPRFENLYIFTQRLIHLNFQNIQCQNITDSIASTIPAIPNPEQNRPSSDKLPTEYTALLKLTRLLSGIGNLFVNNNAGYFIITADIQK